MPHHDHHDGHPSPHAHARGAAMEQLSDEEVMRFAPPEIRRLARRIGEVETRLRDLQETQQEILAMLKGKAAH